MAGEMPDLSGILSGLLSNPAALGALGSLLGSKASEAPPKAEKEEEGDAPPLALEAVAGGEHYGRRSERELLFSALRPYLSPQRRRALDGACKLLEVIELFEKRK